MSSLEFAEWMAYAQLEPWGLDAEARERRADMRNGQLAALIVNRTGGVDGKAVKPEDFLLTVATKPQKKLSPKEKAERLLAQASLIPVFAHALAAKKGGKK